MSRFSTKKKIAAVVLGGALVAAGAGAAYAYWTSSGGTGTGTAATGTQTNTLTVTQTTAPTGLAPGVVPAAVSYTIKNNGTTSAYVTQTVVTVSSVAPAACISGNYGLTAPASVTALTDTTDTAILTAAPTATLAVGQEIAPGATITLAGTFSIGFVDYTKVNQNNCQSAVPTMTYTVS